MVEVAPALAPDTLDPGPAPTFWASDGDVRICQKSEDRQGRRRAGGLPFEEPQKAILSEVSQISFRKVGPSESVSKEAFRKVGLSTSVSIGFP